MANMRRIRENLISPKTVNSALVSLHGDEEDEEKIWVVPKTVKEGIDSMVFFRSPAFEKLSRHGRSESYGNFKTWLDGLIANEKIKEMENADFIN